MKNYLFLLLTLATLQVMAQEKVAPNWFTEITEAEQYAVEQETPILMVFAGSDWCRPCIQFKQDILTSSVFQEYATENLTILYLDFPARRKNKLSAEQTQHNEQLAERYNPSGAFPKIVLIDKQGAVLQQPSFNGQSPEVFLEILQNNSNQ